MGLLSLVDKFAPIDALTAQVRDPPPASGLRQGTCDIARPPGSLRFESCLRHRIGKPEDVLVGGELRSRIARTAGPQRLTVRP
jgi:hypothetical protein